MEKLTIKNYKCFKSLELTLNDLTVLTGCNGNGKSSVVQTMLLMRSAIEKCSPLAETGYDLSRFHNAEIGINNMYCQYPGESAKLLNGDGDESTIQVSYSSDEAKTILDFEVSEESPLSLKASCVHTGSPHPFSMPEFYYLNAERLGPRVQGTTCAQDFPNVGCQGEYTAQILGDSAIKYGFTVDSRKMPIEADGSRFEHKVNAWLDFILPGASIVNPTSDVGHLSASFDVSNRFLPSSSVLPTNTGFGISYLLPIIVTGLLAGEKRVIIVENPEAHLHPSAQSKTGIFLATMAGAGVKVIVETHSDHVINGIQIACIGNRNLEGRVGIKFFSHKNGDTQPSVTNININTTGELSEWPEGFFDQSRIDYMEILRKRGHV